MKPTAAPPARLAYTLPEFRSQVFPCSRQRANEYVRSGELQTFVVNGRRYVTPEMARAFVARKAAAGGEIPPEVSQAKAEAGRKGKAAQLEQARAARREQRAAEAA